MVIPPKNSIKNIYTSVVYLELQLYYGSRPYYLGTCTYGTKFSSDSIGGTTSRLMNFWKFHHSIKNSADHDQPEVCPDKNVLRPDKWVYRVQLEFGESEPYFDV